MPHSELGGKFKTMVSLSCPLYAHVCLALISPDTGDWTCHQWHIHKMVIWLQRSYVLWHWKQEGFKKIYCFQEWKHSSKVSMTTCQRCWRRDSFLKWKVELGDRKTSSNTKDSITHEDETLDGGHLGTMYHVPTRLPCHQLYEKTVLKDVFNILFWITIPGSKQIYSRFLFSSYLNIKKEIWDLLELQ